MNFQVTRIEFDFTDDSNEESLDLKTKESICDSVVGTTWSVESEEDLIDKISDATGWCIINIEYEQK